MDRIKKVRAPLRTSLTRTVNEVQDELSKSDPDPIVLRLKQGKLEKIITELRESDQKILSCLLDMKCTDEDYSEESAIIEDYEDKFSDAHLRIYLALPKSRPSSPVRSDNSIETTATSRRRNFKLPKVELPRFNGDLKEWLGFWAQFRKIHEDQELDASDKFQYLLQATVKGSRARDLVESYPHTADNYPSAVDALKSRFGKDELLVEVYVRELLKLVVSNVNKARDKFVLSKMYDKLETHLRALHSLGVTADKYAAMLFPMVESSLPEELLVAWQRNTLSTKDLSKEEPTRTRLSFLMEFLKNEVEGEERIALARTGFGVSVVHEKGKYRRETTDDSVLPTAAGLFSGKEARQYRCAFCGSCHDSRVCTKAETMTLAEKKSQLREHRCCYICLQPNHMARRCRAKVTCQVCGKRHHEFLCTETSHHQKEVTKCKDGTSSKRTNVENSLSNQTCTEDVLLQTLMVKVVGNGQEKLVRALVDTGSQRSYVLKKNSRRTGMCTRESGEDYTFSVWRNVIRAAGAFQIQVAP